MTKQAYEQVRERSDCFDEAGSRAREGKRGARHACHDGRDAGRKGHPPFGSRMSQQRFASAYRIPLPTLKNWAQGRRYPDAPATAYLLAIKRKPKEVLEAVAG